MRKKVCIVLLAFGALRSGAQDVRPRDLPRLPGAVLLTGYPPYELWLSTSSGIVKVQPSAGESRAIEGPWLIPGITHDGSVVASVRWKRNRPRRVAIATYSVKEGKWTEYAEGDFGDELAISPDGAKLAYVGEGEETRCGYYQTRVHVIDLKTLRETVKPSAGCLTPQDITKNALSSSGLRSSMNFSPTGNRLAFGGGGPIKVWDLDTNTEWQIADGEMPAWSPDGEWIAFLNSSSDQRHSTLGIVHPDGSGERILVKLPRGSGFGEMPVWSPDSKTLLLNQLWDGEKWTMEIRLLDLATLRLKTKFKDVRPVYGWAAESSH